MLDVSQLMRHIRDRDALADESSVALALLIEGGAQNARLSAESVTDLAWPESEAARAEAAAVAVSELRRYISETTSPLPSSVWALGKSYDPDLAGTFASILRRALDRHDEWLAHQALAALTTLPADAVPQDVIRLAAANGNDDLRELAEDWLKLT